MDIIYSYKMVSYNLKTSGELAIEVQYFVIVFFPSNAIQRFYEKRVVGPNPKSGVLKIPHPPTMGSFMWIGYAL